MNYNGSGAKSLAYLRGEIEIDLDKTRNTDKAYNRMRGILEIQPKKKLKPLSGLHKCKYCQGYIFKKQKLCYGCNWLNAYYRSRMMRLE